MTEQRATLVDLRAPAEFAHGHARGAISLPFSERGMAQRLSAVHSRDDPVILMTPEPSIAARATAQLGEVDWRVVGVVETGPSPESGLGAEVLPDIPIAAVAEALKRGERVILDVREPVEWETGHAPGALLVSLGSLRERLPSLPRHPPLAVICEAGVRSSTAASILQAAGFEDVRTIAAGMSGYRRGGLPLEFPAPQG